jgi:hypothetical protein
MPGKLKHYIRRKRCYLFIELRDDDFDLKFYRHEKFNFLALFGCVLKMALFLPLNYCVFLCFEFCMFVTESLVQMAVSIFRTFASFCAACSILFGVNKFKCSW